MNRVAAALLAAVVTACCAQTGMEISFSAGARFVAAHGRYAWAGGYTDPGLEIWAGALQIADAVRPEFRRQGDLTVIRGTQILARVSAEPSHICRFYAGPDFSVEEEVWIPLDSSAVVIRYTVHSTNPVQVIVRFQPSLNLMWPAAIGGQSVRWDGAYSGYVLSEPAHRFAAVVLAPGSTQHDEPLNDPHLPQRGKELAVALDLQSPQIGFAPLSSQAGSLMAESAQIAALEALFRSSQWRQKVAEHAADVLSGDLQIETPDASINRALALAEIDLDQDWFCNEQLGCGYVAGYGPSRRGRRPQYAWYFAGDGMIALHGALAAGNLERARDEIRFIARYQDAATGMIWHELPQSAPYIDWQNKYPLMFVHADLTYPYISAVADYLRQSNDREFLREIWPSVQKAFAYGRSLIGEDGLPRIPAGQLGADEQDALAEELGVSASWIAACNDFAFLSDLMGNREENQEVEKWAAKARVAFPSRYWNARENFSIQGYRRDGQPVADRGLEAIPAIALDLFNEAQSRHILDGIAGWRFQSDWGTRGVPIGEAGFSATGYAHGSVSGLGTAKVAQTFWAAHRPATAFQIWDALVPWFWLDSPGHMHEVLLGNVYYPQSESVPEQTWSTAGFLTAAVRGLFGFDRNAVTGVLTLAPHLPADWPHARLSHVRMGSSTLSFAFDQTVDSLTLHVENSGDTLHLRYGPAIPLGAENITAALDGRKTEVHVEEHPEDEHAVVDLALPHGNHEITLHYAGSIAIILPEAHPAIAAESSAMKLNGVALRGNVLHLEVDAMAGTESKLGLRTARRILRATGARLLNLGGERYELAIVPDTIVPATVTPSPVTPSPTAPVAAVGYQHVSATVVFAGGK